MEMKGCKLRISLLLLDACFYIFGYKFLGKFLFINDCIDYIANRPTFMEHISPKMKSHFELLELFFLALFTYFFE